MVYTDQIIKFLENHITDSNACIVVTSLDKLPTNPTFPLYCVINEDISTQPGSHWICLYINKKGENKEKYNVVDFNFNFSLFSQVEKQFSSIVLQGNHYRK